jgi:3-hydroxyacyl-[acyl-carrier-protein] dehydratase
MPPVLIKDPLQVDTSQVVCDREGLRKINPQRFEMEQLDAIVYVDFVQHLCIGYKDVRSDEFWVRGHMPEFPLMPGVLMCEAAAQLVSYYYTVTSGLKADDIVGFGGMEDVRFRGTVRPGDRLLLIGKGRRLHRRQTIFQVQGFVGKAMVFHADIIGIPLSKRAVVAADEES